MQTESNILYNKHGSFGLTHTSSIHCNITITVESVKQNNGRKSRDTVPLMIPTMVLVSYFD